MPRLRLLGFPHGTVKQCLQAGWQIGEVPTCSRSPVKTWDANGCGSEKLGALCFTKFQTLQKSQAEIREGSVPPGLSGQSVRLVDKIRCTGRLVALGWMQTFLDLLI